MEYLFIISLFCLGAVFTLGGVALGGWLVYRTKRDPYEPMFGGTGKGDSFNLDDGLDVGDDPATSAGLPGVTEKANSNFIKQFAENLADKVS